MTKKCFFVSILSFFVLSSCMTLWSAENETEKTLHPSQDASWEMTFEDNFDGTELDANKWFPGYRLGCVEHYTCIGFPNDHVRGW